MNEEQIISIAQGAIFMAIEIATPVMIIGLLVGIVIALFQALTQIQEMTLTFVPKIVAILFAIFLMLPAFAIKMTEYMRMLSDQIIAGGMS